MEIFVVDLIKSVGFPIFVAVYMMIVMKKSIDRNTEAIQDLKDWLKDNRSKVKSDG